MHQQTTTATRWRFEPNPKRKGLCLTSFQEAIVRNTKRNFVGVAARRSGKTVGIRCRLTTTSLRIRNGLVGYCAPTLGQAKRLLWVPLCRDLAAPEAQRFVYKVNHSELWIQWRNGTHLRLYGAERPEQIRGDGFDEFCTDESDDPNFDSTFFDEIVGPALSDQEGTLFQIGSPKGRGRLYREFRKGQRGDELHDPDYASIQVTAIEAGILSRAEIERARRIRSDRAFRQEYMADFLAPAGVVFDEFDDSVHVVTAEQLPLRFDEVIVGVDWGTSNRGSMVVLGIDRVYVPPVGILDGEELARVWVIEEHSHAGLGYDDGGWWPIARGIQERWQPTVWYADPAGGLEGYLKQLKRALEGGGRATVVGARNEVRPGISTLRDLMHHSAIQEGADIYDRPRFYVLDGCSQVRRTLGAYRYKSHPRYSDEFLEEPVKEDDHEIDAIRYAAHSHLGARDRGHRRAA